VLHSLMVAQLLRSAACLHTNQSRSYLNHLVQPRHQCGLFSYVLVHGDFSPIFYVVFIHYEAVIAEVQIVCRLNLYDIGSNFRVLAELVPVYFITHNV